MYASQLVRGAGGGVNPSNIGVTTPTTIKQITISHTLETGDINAILPITVTHTLTVA